MAMALLLHGFYVLSLWRRHAHRTCDFLRNLVGGGRADQKFIYSPLVSCQSEVFPVAFKLGRLLFRGSPFRHLHQSTFGVVFLVGKHTLAIGSPFRHLHQSTFWVVFLGWQLASIASPLVPPSDTFIKARAIRAQFLHVSARGSELHGSLVPCR